MPDRLPSIQAAVAAPNAAATSRFSNTELAAAKANSPARVELPTLSGSLGSYTGRTNSSKDGATPIDSKTSPFAALC